MSEFGTLRGGSAKFCESCCLLYLTVILLLPLAVGRHRLYIAEREATITRGYEALSEKKNGKE